MSIKLMGQVWEKELGHSEQCILLAMADYADDDGRNCYPSYERLAWKTGYSKRQVQRIIQGLCDSGIIVILKQSSQHHSTHYWIRIDKASAKTPFVSAARVDIYDTENRVDKMSTLNGDDQSRVDTVSTLDDSRVDILNTEKSQGGHLRHPGWTNETSRVDMVSTDPLVNHQLDPKEDDDDTHAREPVALAWFDIYGTDIPENIKAPLVALEAECGTEAVIHAIGAGASSSSRSFKFIATCARNYIPPSPAASAPSYTLDVPGVFQLQPPAKAAPTAPPPPLATSDPWQVILAELHHELMADAPAHKWLKGSALVQVGDVVGVPLYQVQVNDATGVSWLSNRLAATIRKKLSVLLRQRVLVEIVCTEMEMA